MNYKTPARAIEVAAELNKTMKDDPHAYAVQDEKGIFTIVLHHHIQNWLLAHSARKLIYPHQVVRKGTPIL